MHFVVAPQPSTFRLLKPRSTTAATSPLVHSAPRSALHVALWSAQWQLLAYQPAEMPREVASCVIERGSGNCENTPRIVRTPTFRTQPAERS